MRKTLNEEFLVKNQEILRKNMEEALNFSKKNNNDLETLLKARISSISCVKNMPMPQEELLMRSPLDLLEVLLNRVQEESISQITAANSQNINLKSPDKDSQLILTKSNENSNEKTFLSSSKPKADSASWEEEELQARLRKLEQKLFEEFEGKSKDLLEEKENVISRKKLGVSVRKKKGKIGKMC